MSRPKKDLEARESRIGRSGERVYLYSGRFRTADAIRRMREDQRQQYVPVEHVGLPDEVRAKRIEALVDGLVAGRTWDAISEEIGISRQALYDTVKGADEAQRRRVRRAQERFRRDQAKSLGRWMREGRSVAEIGELLGRSPASIRRTMTDQRRRFPELLPEPAEYARLRRERRARELAAVLKKHKTFSAAAASMARTPTSFGSEYRRLRAEFGELMPPPARGKDA